MYICDQKNIYCKYNYLMSLQVYYVANKVLDASSPNVIETDLYLPQPAVTSRFVVNVVEGNPSVVFRLDIIGLNPAKKYSIDPMLDQLTYQDCKRLNCCSLILMILVLWRDIKPIYKRSLFQFLVKYVLLWRS